MNSHSQSPNQRAQGTNGSADGVADPVFLETLLANEERLRLAVEATQLGILDFDPINGQQTLNAEALRLWGFSNDVNPTPERLLNAVHPDDRELLRSVTAESLNPHGSGRFSIEHRVIHPDGSLRWLSVSASTIFKGENENRRAVRSIGMMFDITERRLREEALQATEERLRARNKQLSFLARVSQLLILNDLPENELLTLVLNEAAATVGADTFLYYRAEDENTLRLHCCGGLAETERTPLEVVPIGGALCGHVAQHRYPLVIENAAEGGNAASELLVAAGFRAYAGFPLIAGDRLLGTIAIITRSKSHFAEGEIQSLQTACEQISATLERLRLAHELRTSEERQRLAMEGAGLGAWDVDLVSGKTVWNRVHTEVQGYQPEQESASVERWKERVHPDDLDNVLAHIEQAKRQRTLISISHRLRRADTGDERWLSLYGRFIYDSTGNAVRLLGVSQDVTERKVAEETVRSHSELLAAVFEFMPAAINIIRGSDLRLVLANPGYRAIAPGKGDPVGKTLDELWPETGRDFSTLCRHVLETGEPYHAVDQLVHIQRSFDGPIENAYFTWSLFRIRLPGNEGWGIFNAAWETTHRVKAEKALRESEARFRHMADNAPVMIWVTEADGCCTFLSKSWLEFTGQTSEAALGFGWLAAVHPADTDQAHKLFMEATARHESFAMEYRLRHQDGHYSWVYDSARPRFSETGEFLGFIGSVIDITSRKHSEDAIKATRDSFRQLVEQSPFGVYAVDADFRLAMVSAGAQKVFENVRPLLGRDFSEVLRTIWPEPFVSNVLDKFRRVLATGESYHAPRTVEQRADIRETESYDWKLERFVLPDGRPGVVCHFYDLSERQRYEETLRIANNRLETALHASQVALSHQDKDLRYTWAHNPGLGYSSQDLLGKRAREVLQRGEDAVNVDAIKRKVLETGTATRTEIKLWQDGQFRYYDLVVQPDRNPNGEIIGVNSAAIDITDRKRIEAALRESEQKQVFLLRLSDALRSLSDPAAIQKQATRVLGEHLRVDRACYVEISEETGIFKIEHEYNRGDSRSLVGQLSIKDFQWVIPLMRTGDLVVVSDVRQSPVIPVDDRAMMETIQIAAHVNAPLIKSDQLVGALCVTEPVPRQWTNIELELIKETAERIWSAVERARAEAALKESDQRKDEFLATLSHELRNPLATLQTGLEVLSRNPEQPTLVQTTGLMMRRQLTHLVALVDDLLEVSRISRGKLKLRQETVELSDAIYAAIEMSRPIIEETRHSLQVDIPSETILIHGDPHRLTQLFCNLLNNAAKYTPNGGKIEIKVELDGKDVVTAIKDSGIGLAAEQLTRVFDLFTQVEKDSPDYAGLGIGLSLVKSLVQLHGGRTWAESAGRNQGSTFFVRLPRSTAVLISEPTSMVDHTSSAHPTKVLVVDDNIDAGNTLALLIKLMGHQVSTATNGQEAVDKGRVMQPDLILMDIGMPIMDGYAAARAIRQETWGQSVALIALTGWGQDEDRQKSKAAGFDQHLVKPVDATAIQRVISEHKPRSQNV